MSSVNDVVPKTSDNLTSNSNNNSASDLSAGIWSSMQLDSQSKKSAEPKSDETNQQGLDPSSKTADNKPKPDAAEGTAERVLPQIDFEPSSPASGTAERVVPLVHDGPRTTASGSAERQPAGITPGDKSPHPSTIFAPSLVTDRAGNVITDRGGRINANDDNTTLVNHFDQQAQNTVTERQNSPAVVHLTPGFHTQSQQMIRDADNLPQDRIEMDLNQQNSDLKYTRQLMDADERSIAQQAEQQSPEVQDMVRSMLDHVDSPRFQGLHGENLERLRQIAPELAETFDSRRDLGRQAADLHSNISDSQRLRDMPVSARFQYAAELLDAGGAPQAALAVRQLTDILNRDPNALNFSMPGSSGNRTMAELILRSNALDSKAFSHAFHRAGGNPNTLRETWARDRFRFN